MSIRCLPMGRAEFSQTARGFQTALQCPESTEERFLLESRRYSALSYDMQYGQTASTHFLQPHSSLFVSDCGSLLFFFKGFLNSKQEEISYCLCVSLTKHAASQHFPLKLYNSTENICKTAPPGDKTPS